MSGDGVPRLPGGGTCLWCGEPAVEGEPGQMVRCVELGENGTPVARRRPAHAECLLRQTLGGPAHLIRRTCTCCGGTDEPDLGLPPREAAWLVWGWVQAHGASA